MSIDIVKYTAIILFALIVLSFINAFKWAKEKELKPIEKPSIVSEPQVGSEGKVKPSAFTRFELKLYIETTDPQDTKYVNEQVQALTRLVGTIPTVSKVEIRGAEGITLYKERWEIIGHTGSKE